MELFGLLRNNQMLLVGLTVKAIFITTFVVVDAVLFLALCSTYLRSGEKYEELLMVKYPEIAKKRRQYPFYAFTWRAFPVFWIMTGESDLKDEELVGLRKKTRLSLILSSVPLLVVPVTAIFLL